MIRAAPAAPSARSVAILTALWGALHLCGATAEAANPAAPDPTPFLDRRSEPLEYRGPGRDDAAPADLSEIRIGWFGPSDPAAGDFWAGAALATGEINASGGVSGLPIRLVPGWSESPWAGGVSRVARMVYEDNVFAIIGSIDGAATHLAEQVVAKALVTLISPGSTDKTVSFAGVPWMFTMLPGDDVQAEALAAWLSLRREARPIALVSATDHDARVAAAEMRAALERSGLPLAADLQCAPDAAEAATVAEHVVARAPRAVVLFAAPQASGRLAASLRGAGYRGAILGGSTLARRSFRGAAGAAAEGAVVALPYDPGSDRWTRFARDFAAGNGRDPDFAAGSAYDAVRLVAEAARRAGPNRARIRDAVRALSPWEGVLGEVRFDNLGRNQRPVRLGTLHGGGVRVSRSEPAP